MAELRPVAFPAVMTVTDSPVTAEVPASLRKAPDALTTGRRVDVLVSARWTVIEFAAAAAEPVGLLETYDVTVTESVFA